MLEIVGRSYARITSWHPDRVTVDRGVCLANFMLPAAVGSVSGTSRRALCIGPGDWLLMARDWRELEADGRLHSEASEQGFALADLSDALACFGVRGRAARDVLATGCGLDLHPQSLPPGRCARTRLAQIPVVIECVDVEDELELLVARSYARYLADWLADAWRGASGATR
ncbi:MAG: sarcosine oxidase subunit gamma family protein [Gammaproteobacteria bacterium]